MSGPRRWYALFLLAATLTLMPAAHGQPPAKEAGTGGKPAEAWLTDRALTVTPAAAPVPALKYRLYPSTVERKDGNAVPIYLRFAHERSDAKKKQLREKPLEWNKLPLDRLPMAEVKEFLKGHDYNLRQLELGARRKTADWSFTLDAGDPIGLRLPDVQEMRLHAPLLVLKARVEIAEGRYADAVRTLETGFSFSRQINEGPFYITSLVGIALANLLADCLLDLIDRPDGPNLYWALAVIPRPLISLRNAGELEMSILELQFPEMADLGRSRPPEEWGAILRRMRAGLEEASKGDANARPPKPGNAPADPAAKSPDLPAARKYLVEVVGMQPAKVEAMPPAQVLLLHVSHYYHEIRDEMFKAAYLPYPQARPLFAEAEKRIKTQPDTEAAQWTRILLPAVPKVQLAKVRLDRKLALLRAIEALRMHAAASGGKLPEKLSDVTIVPVPNDPGTGQPFEYQRDGQTATLSSRIPGEPQEKTGLRYRLTLRK
jgi:hypothetical protein